MKELNLEEQIKVLKSKKNDAAFLSAVSLLISGGLSLSTVAIAAAGGITSLINDEIFNNVAKDFMQTEEFQVSIRDRRNQLIDDLSNGKISYEEFKKLYEGLETSEEVIAYSDNNPENEELAKSVRNYRGVARVGDDMLIMSPLVLGSTIVGFASAVGFDKLKSYYNKKLTKLNGEQELETTEEQDQVETEQEM